MHSKPLLQILLPIITGIVLARFFPVSIPVAFLITVILALLTLIILKFNQGIIVEVLFLTTLIAFGFSRQTHFEQGFSPNHVKNLQVLFNLPVRVTGELKSTPETKKYYQILQLEIQQIQTGTYQFPAQGNIRCYLPIVAEKFKPGDRLQLGGTLKSASGARNPGGFDFSKYLASKSIYAILSVRDSSQIKIVGHEAGNWFKMKIIQPLKNAISSRLERLMPSATANLFKGLILAQKQDISDEFLQSLSFTGTSHILAVSGLHTGFVLLILWLVLRIMRFPSILATILTIAGLIFFALLTGARPPVIRAVIMANVFLVGSQIQRYRDVYNNLAFAAFIILLVDPSELFNPGFQLSFSAVFSILYLYPRITRSLKRTQFGERLFKSTTPGYLVSLLIVSLAVWLGTLPIVAYYFYIIPFIGILANIVVVPLIGILLALGIVALISSTFSLTIGLIYSETIQLLANGLFQFIGSLATFPGSHFFVPRPELSIFLIYYTILLLGTQWQRPKIRKVSLILLLLLLNWRVWDAALFEEKRLQVLHFDVGQGDATFVRFPNSKTMLIDGGDRNDRFDCGKMIISPYLRMRGISQVDYLMMTHPHNDHLGGLLYILRNFKVKQIFVNGDSCDSPIFHEFQSVTDSLQIPMQTLKTGDLFYFSENVDFWVLHPPDSSGITENHENNNSIVIKLIYGNSTFLLTGDIEIQAEQQLLHFGSLLNSEILKVAHHGSISSSMTPFLKKVNPSSGVISVGKRNRFKHPSPTTLKRLQAEEIEILRTDQSGAILFESNGIKTRRIEWH